MKCPYCQSEVPALATVCAACRRDFRLVQTLQRRVAELEQAVSAAEAMQGPADTLEPSTPLNGASAKPPFPAWAVWVTAAAVLVIAHLLVIVAFDLPTLWLRVATLFIPLPFGYLAAHHSERGFLWNFCVALVVSLVSVCAMSAAVAMVDGTSVVPDSRFAVVEFGEYVASIAFSFATGLLLGGALGRAATKLVRWFISTRAAPHDPLRQRIELARNILTSMAAIGTTIASVVTGLHHLINK